MSAVETARRRFLLGRSHAAATRPPWTDAAAIATRCTRCGDCITACPEAILTRGEDGFPILDARQGICTFCGACAAACTQAVFEPARSPAQPARPIVSSACLQARGIVCEICRDACPTAAIRFPRRPGIAAGPTIDRDRCTGCGGCVAPCPVGAITLNAPGFAYGA